MSLPRLSIETSRWRREWVILLLRNARFSTLNDVMNRVRTPILGTSEGTVMSLPVPGTPVDISKRKVFIKKRLLQQLAY